MSIDADLDVLLARLFLELHCTRAEAYRTLHAQLMRCYLERGGSVGDWCTHYAPAFVRRFGWMLVEH